MRGLKRTIMAALFAVAVIILTPAVTAHVYAAEQETRIALTEENFPDDNFRAYLEDYYSVDGYIDPSQVTELYVLSCNINSLEGIAYFTELTYLDCNENNLSSLDVSKNTKLQYLFCDYNNLSRLDVSKNTKLIKLDCANNFLKEVTGLSNTKVGVNDKDHYAFEPQRCKEHQPVVDKAVAATCVKSGLTQGSHCSVCGKVLVEQKVIPATKKHTYGASKVTKAASCTEMGVKTSVCKVCGAEKAEDIPLLEHTSVKDKAVAATCVKSGLTQGSHCSICKKVLVAQKKIPATRKHTYGKYKITKQPTALVKGKKVRKCTGCGKKDEKSIAKLTPTIKLSKTKVTLQKGKSIQIKVSKLAKGDSVKSWTSENKKIATVKKGVIKAVKKGTVKVTVTLKSGKKAVVKVTVR